MKLQRVYYTLLELAQEWGKTETELLQSAAAGELELSARHVGNGLRQGKPRVEISGFVQLLKEDAGWILENGIEKYYVLYGVKWQCDQIIFPGPPFPNDPDFKIMERPVILYSTSDLYILPDEAARVEAIYGLSGQIHQQETFVNDDEKLFISNKDIAKEAEMSFNSFEKYADLAGITIGKTEGNRPKNMVTKSDIKKVQRFMKDYREK